jgi:hypothetical protein
MACSIQTFGSSWNSVSRRKDSDRMEVNWDHLAQDRDRWRAVVNAVMNLWMRHKAGNFLAESARIGFSSTLLHVTSGVQRLADNMCVHSTHSVRRTSTHLCPFDMGVCLRDVSRPKLLSVAFPLLSL